MANSVMGYNSSGLRSLNNMIIGYNVAMAVKDKTASRAGVGLHAYHRLYGLINYIRKVLVLGFYFANGILQLLYLLLIESFHFRQFPTKILNVLAFFLQTAI